MNYRVYYVGSDGHFIKCDDIEAHGDEEAMVQVRQLVDGQAFEVWQGERLVMTKAKKKRDSLFKLFQRRNPK